MFSMSSLFCVINGRFFVRTAFLNTLQKLGLRIISSFPGTRFSFFTRHAVLFLTGIPEGLEKEGLEQKLQGEFRRVL